MTYIKTNLGLYLDIDIDDNLVYSSDKIQWYLDNLTNFKTEVLNMLEQLCRNCNYLVSEVELECKLAKESHRAPDLMRFKIFSDLSKMDSSEWYTKPIEICKRYQKMAKLFLNQFLEERDTFLEIDNLPKGSIIPFNYKKEMAHIANLAEEISNNLPMFHKINEFCLEEVQRMIDEAKKKSTVNNLVIPNYGLLVTMDTNDIIKKNSIHKSDANKKEVIYDLPLKKVYDCYNLEGRLYDIITNARIFTEPSAEIVQYDQIHRPENVNWDAAEFYEDVLHSGIFTASYTLSHANGERENIAKRKLTKMVLPEVDSCITVRFHNGEHNVVRRDRSDKYIIAASKVAKDPRYGVLGDDSIANCAHCKKDGGTEILYKPMTESEIINGRLVDLGYNRIIDYKNNNAYKYITEAEEKVKRLTKNR